MLDEAFWGYLAPNCYGGRLRFNDTRGDKYRNTTVPNDSIVTLGGLGSINLGACHRSGTVMFERNPIDNFVVVTMNLAEAGEALIRGGFSTGSPVTSFHIQGGVSGSDMSGKVHAFKLAVQ